MDKHSPAYSEILAKVKNGSLSAEAAYALLRGTAASPAALAEPPKGEAAPKAAAPPKATAPGAIAVIGMSGRFPQAPDLERFWENLAQGRDSVVRVPPERWDADRFYDPDPANLRKTYCPKGAFLEDIDLFDPVFFNLSGKEAEVMDPQQRIFLEEAWKALEDGGYANDSVSNARCGVFVGVAGEDYSRKMRDLDLDREPQSFWGNDVSILTARICYLLNLKGASLAVHTACSSSLVALHLACQSLLSGENDMALAGGVYIGNTPEFNILCSNAGMLSPQGKCRAFDDGADGFVIGEGAGAVLLKPLAAAIADRDPIHAVLLGSGINQDGKTNGIIAPSSLSQSDLETSVYAKTGISPETIGYVEAHGTGTRLGDPIEIEALTRAFRSRTARKQFCAIGSVKSNIGHAITAAGIAGLIKVLLALKRGELPPSLHFDEANRGIAFADTPFFVNTRLIPWDRPQGFPRRAAISSFGFSGTNAHVVVEEAPERPARAGATPPIQCVCLSAKTRPALERKLKDLLEWLAGPGRSAALEDVAFSLQTGRSHFPIRFAAVVADLGELRARLSDAIAAGLPGNSQDTQGVRRAVPDREAWETPLRELAVDPGMDAGAYRERLERIAHAWLQGAMPEWKRLHEGGNARRISLPAYPFQRRRYWLPEAPPQRVSEPPAAAPAAPTVRGPSPLEAAPMDDFILAPVWPAMAPPARASAPTGKVLLFARKEASAMRSAFLGALHNREVRVCLMGSEDRQTGNEWEFDAGDGAAWGRVLERAGRADSIYYLEEPIAGESAGNGSREAGAEAETGATSAQAAALRCFRLCKALEASGRLGDGTRIRFATRGLFTTGPGDKSDAHAGALPGMVGALAREFPGLDLALFDLEAGGAKEGSQLLVLQTKALVAAEGVRREGGLVALRGTEWRVRSLEPVALPAVAADPIRPRGVYLIAGGAGGIGLSLAEYLAERAQARIILLGRGEPDAEKCRRFADIGSKGGEILYLQADLRDEGSMRAALERAHARFGRIQGAFHSAMVARDGALASMQEADFLAAVEPKIAGSLGLLRALRDDKPDFTLFFSSVVGVCGNAGQANYAAGCSFQDALAWAEESSGPGRIKVVDWGFWGLGASGSQELRGRFSDQGLHPIPLREGMEAIRRTLAQERIQSIALKAEAQVREGLRIPSHGLTEAGEKAAAQGAPSVPASPARVEGAVKACLAAVLKVAEGDFDADAPYTDLGFDSLLAVQVVKAINAELGISLRSTDLYNFPTLRGLVGHILAAFPSVAPGNAASLPVPAERAPESATVPDAPGPSAPQARADDIAIIGMAGRFPGAEDVETFWRNLEAGADAVGEIPRHRWDMEPLFDPDPRRPDKSYSKWAGLLDEVDKFDPLFFSISPAEAEAMDPQQRIFLEEAWRALEDAGYPDAAMRGKRCGVYVGCKDGAYKNLLREKNAYLALGNSSSILAARIAYFLDLKGPALSVDTACSSSLVAAHLACEALRSGAVEMALAGGVSLTLTGETHVVLSRSEMLSPEGKCKTFDAAADGFAPGEGAAVLVLKPLRAALRDGDRIHAVIKGSAMNQDGKTNGITAPSAPSQTALECEVYERSGIRPETLGYVEAHGTGTKLGDPIEIHALTDAFRKYTDKRGFCAVGSVKTNIGHCLEAAGIMGLLKLALCLREGKLAPSLHFREPNEHIDFADSPFYVPTRTADWPSLAGAPRRGAVSSFGFSGTNVHMVLEEAPAPNAAEAPPTQAMDAGLSAEYPVLFSAKTEGSLRRQWERMAAWLDGAGAGCSLADLAFTAAGRGHFLYRSALIAKDIPGLRAGLRARLDEPDSEKRSASRAGAGKDVRSRGLALFALAAGSPGAGDPGRAAVLGGLAECYEAGFDCDWPALFPRRGCKRVSLPGYPFARDSYWPAPPLSEAIASAPGSASWLHPLLQRNASTLQEARFSRLLAGTEAFLADYRVGGLRMLPDSLFLEWARAAGESASEAETGVLADVTWGDPFVFTGSATEIQAGLRSEGDGVAFEIRSLPGDSVVAHCQGRLVFRPRGAAAPRKAFPLEATRKHCTRLLEAEPFYALFRERGLAMGPLYRGVADFRWNGGEALARFALPAGTLLAGYAWHPAWLEAAVQAALALAWEQGPGPGPAYCLERLDRMEWLGPFPRQGYLHAVLRGAGDESLGGSLKKTADVSFLDAAGNEVGILRGLVLRSARSDGPDTGAPRETDAVSVPDSFEPDAPEPLVIKAYRESWRHEAQPTAWNPAEWEGDTLFLDRGESSKEAFQAGLARTGIPGRAIVAKPGNGFARLGPLLYRIRPGAPEDYRELMRSLKGEGIQPLNLVHMGFARPGGGEEALGAASSGSDQEAFGLFCLAQAWDACGFKPPRRFVFVHNEERGEIDLRGRTAPAFLRSLAMLWPGTAFTSMRMASPGADALDVVLSGAEAVPGAVLEAQWMEGLLLRRTLEPLSLAGDKRPPLRRGGVYLITGGAGGLGILFARHLAAKYAAKLVLIGRAGPGTFTTRSVAQLEALGGQAIYLSADVAQPASIRAAVAEGRRIFGGLHGVLHAAGVQTRDTMMQKTPDGFLATLRPKVEGTLALDEATADEPLDFFALFSSLASSLGDFGQGDYAVANRFLEEFAGHRQTLRKSGSRSGRTVSIAWPLWREGGMHMGGAGEDLYLQASGLGHLSAGDGLRLFEDVLASGEKSVTIVYGKESRLRGLPGFAAEEGSPRNPAVFTTNGRRIP